MERVFFAYTFPWSYIENERYLDKLLTDSAHRKDLYTKKETIIRSNEKRDVTMLTITSNKGKLAAREPEILNLFKQQKSKAGVIKTTLSNKIERPVDPNSNEEIKEEIITETELEVDPEEGLRPFKFENKKYIFLSGRVHPGETPASHMLNGLLNFLFSDPNVDLRVKLILDNFVFVIIPILNPDGVFRGHYRQDVNGNNLNRMYVDYTKEKEPTIYAVMKLIKNLTDQDKLFMYLDFHAHANINNVFMFGNHLEYHVRI